MEDKKFKQVLLIDDDVFIVQLLTLVLTKSGYKVVSATNGKQAITLLPLQTVDLIIVDLMMPEMDGLQFLQTLRGELKATMPVLVLSGMVTATTESQVMTAGANALLYKPIKVPDLLVKIRQLEALAQI